MDTKLSPGMISPSAAPVPVSLFRSTQTGLKVMDESDLDDLLPFTRPGPDADVSPGVTYREYFNAIQRAVLDHWSRIVDFVVQAAIPQRLDIREVRIIGEKHGSDYHPARIAVVCTDRTYSFVMNVALTPRGMARITQEFDVLRLLSTMPGPRYVPKVYFLGDPCAEAETDQPIASRMFLGEWLEAYHEFHLTEGSEEEGYDTILWDGDSGRRLLPREIAWEIFRQSAFILTWYYDLATFHEVYPWHHAAGDFVAQVKEGPVSVRLVAARQYEPRIIVPPSATIGPMDSLLAFFANLTVRNRLDRLDGVGRVVFAGTDCVEATVRGFFGALRAKATGGHCNSELPACFAKLAGALSPGDWAEVFRDLVDSYNAEAPDLPAIMESLPDHIFQVYRLLRSA
ncbi:MAG: hypothetical protein LDL33_03570 [Desulfomonile sp.]|nr:hypothetical protein [Desulfomonile sp.]